MLEYLKKSCRLTDPELDKSNPANGTAAYVPTAFDPNGGLLHVSWANRVDPVPIWLCEGREGGRPVSESQGVWQRSGHWACFSLIGQSLRRATEVDADAQCAAGYRAAGCVPQILPSALAIDAQRGLAGYLTDRPEIVYIAGSSLGSPNLTIIGAVAAAWMPIAFSRDNVTIRSHYSQREHRRISSSILLNWLDNSVDAQIATSCDQEIGEIRMTEPANTIKAGPEHLPCSHAQTGGQVLDYIRQSATRI
ncbi:hypothetical protein PG985_015055 [Apiospora marii]|uniref:uncharacterized protein n=1 Tax=Apiospora marii TaxID=335849 RepID=UPI00312F5BDE